MAVNISIRNLSRTPIRVGGFKILSTASQVVDVSLGAVRRDLHHAEGQWVVTAVTAGALSAAAAITDFAAVSAETASGTNIASAYTTTGATTDIASKADLNTSRVELKAVVIDVGTLVTELTALRTKFNSVLATLRTNGLVTP